MIKRIVPLMALALVAGCSSKTADLQRFIAQTKQEQPSGVEPLPEVKPYDTFTYTVQSLRSPFLPGSSGEAVASIRPDSRRNREYLEQFSLDTLRMVGTLRLSNRNIGLVQTRDGRVHRVSPGHYLGQNEGRIESIDASRISITEIVPDGLGGFMERSAALALNE